MCFDELKFFILMKVNGTIFFSTDSASLLPFNPTLTHKDIYIYFSPGSFVALPPHVSFGYGVRYGLIIFFHRNVQFI